MNRLIGYLMSSVALLVLVAPATPAELDKKQCKNRATSVVRLARDLGVTNTALGASGRSLAGQVQGWIAENDHEAVAQMQTEIESALLGVKACESSGFESQVAKVEDLAQTLRSGALPWFRNAAAHDPCQQIIAAAVKKRDGDPDAAIEELQRAIGECRLGEWRREGRHQLAVAYFARGDQARDDFAGGREQVRAALGSAAGLDDEQRTLVTGVLARATIEAGRSLMQSGSFAAAATHWQGYGELFGTSGFDPLFDSAKASSGAAGLRSLRDAKFQWALACLETGDAGCVEQRTANGEATAEVIDALDALATRAFELAANATSEDTFILIAFDLLDRWHDAAPDSYQLKRLLHDRLVELQPTERQRRLRLTEHCWIPTATAGALREAEAEFVEEATIAVSCEGEGGAAAAMLAAVEIEAARSLLDQVAFTPAGDERAAIESRLEAMLGDMGDSPEVRALREGLETDRARRRANAAKVTQNSDELYADCTTVLATIQWNESHDESTAAEVRQFKTGCCTFLRKNRAGWVHHLKSKLGEGQVQAKQRLMDGYCAR